MPTSRSTASSARSHCAVSASSSDISWRARSRRMIGRPYLEVACLARPGFASKRQSFAPSRARSEEAIAAADAQGGGNETSIPPALASLGGTLIWTGDVDRGERGLERAAGRAREIPNLAPACCCTSPPACSMSAAPGWTPSWTSLRCGTGPVAHDLSFRYRVVDPLSNRVVPGPAPCHLPEGTQGRPGLTT